MQNSLAESIIDLAGLRIELICNCGKISARSGLVLGGLGLKEKVVAWDVDVGRVV